MFYSASPDRHEWLGDIIQCKGVGTISEHNWWKGILGKENEIQKA